MSDESLFREVDEEVRQEEYQKIWARYGNMIMAAVAALVIGVGAYQGYSYLQVSKAEKAGEVYFDAIKKIQDGKLDDALATLKAVDGPGYTQLAALQQADVLAEKGETQKAVEAYDAFIAGAGNDAMLVDLAKIKAATALVDTASVDDLKKRIGAFDDDKNTWRHHAREIMALASWRTGDFAAAATYAADISLDLEAPQAMKQRAQVLSELLASKLPKK